MTLLTRQNPGVHTFESTFGPLSIEQSAFQNMYLTVTARRGIAGVDPDPVTSPRDVLLRYGRRISTSFLHDAIRNIYAVVSTKVWVNRVVADDAVKATKTLKGGGTSQVETATAAGTVSGSGNATVTVTAVGMTNSPKAVSVPVVNGDTASVVGGKIRAALEADVDVSAFFEVSGSGANVVLTAKAHTANDGTMNIAIATGTATGITAAPTSANTTAGVADVDVLEITAKGVGSDYNYSAGPPKVGVAVTWINGTFRVFDYSTGSIEAIEVFYDVTKENYQEKVEEINATSNLIDVEWVEPDEDPLDYSTNQGLTGGTDGSAIVNADIVGDEEDGTGIYAFLDKSFAPGFLMAPGYTDETVGLALLDVASRNRKLALIDSTFGIGSSVSSLITEKQQYASQFGRAIYVAQWVKQLDPDIKAQKFVPRSPIRAAQIAASHNFPGSIANVGAGTKFVLPNVTKLEYDFNDLDHDELNRNGVDIARNFSKANRGIISFSARTVSGDIRYRFNSVRVIFDVLADSIEKNLIDYVFELISDRLKYQVEKSIDQFLMRLWREGVLFGKNAADAYKIVVLNDPVQEEQGILSIDVYVKPTPPAERILVTFYRTSLSVDFKKNAVFASDITAA